MKTADGKPDRVILHCDMNSFFASCELTKRPGLKDLPVAVSGSEDNRHGIILAENYIAKDYGVKTAETVWQAKRKCPDLILLPPHYDMYMEFNRKINRIFLDYTDMVEPFSIDESWLDVTGSGRLFGTGREIADTIRERVKEELGITLSAGVSFNKIFAKMGSEYKKPDATTEITRENFKDILWPMPVHDLFFCGFATANRLNEIGIMTIGDLAESDPAELEKIMGKQGPQLVIYARGEDESPVKNYDQKEKIKSVGNGITFKRDLVGEDDVMTALTELADIVSGRLRKYRLKCCGVKVDIKDTKLKSISRQKKIDIPTCLAEDLRQVSFDIVRDSWNMNKPIRMLTVTGINLIAEDEGEQLSLFGSQSGGLTPCSQDPGASGTGDLSERSMEERNKKESLEHAMDDIRHKFGKDSIKFGRVIGNDIGIDI